MKIGDSEFDFCLTSRDLLRAKTNHVDLGDFQNDQLRKVAVDPISAIESAFWLYQPKLKDAGVKTIDEFADAVDQAGLNEFHNKFREVLADFFPILATVIKEIKAATEAND